MTARHPFKRNMVIRMKGEHQAQAFSLYELCIVVAIIGLLCSMAVRGYAKAREATQREVCVENLEKIHAMKVVWAIEHEAGDGRQPSLADLEPFFGGERFPICPAGGTYVIGKVKDPPSCSAGHKLESFTYSL